MKSREVNVIMRWFRVVGALIVAAVAGCARQAPPPDFPAVTGKVMLDGKPLPGAGVAFVPTGSTVGHGAVGATDDSGIYKLRGSRGGEGAPPGEYKVVISRWMLPDGKPPPRGVPPANSGAVETVPPAYTNATTTPLKATVAEAGGSFDFELRSGR
jgi:hypothetical protein